MNKLIPKWYFKQLLQEEMVTVNQLYSQLKDEVSRNGLYKWSNKQPKSINLEHAGVVLSGLSAITGKDYAISDLISFELVDSDGLEEKIKVEQDAFQSANDEQLIKLDAYDWGEAEAEHLGESLRFVDGEWILG